MPGLVERLQVGKREDLADFIAVADAKATPVMSAIPKGKKLTNTLMQWPVDNYPAVNLEGVVDEEDVNSFDNLASGRALLTNYVQKRRRQFKVSDLSEMSDVAGVGQGEEFAKAAAKAIIMLKRDIESVICSDDDAQADTGEVGYETRGLGTFIKATAGTVLPISSSYLTPSASIDTTAMASLTESTVGDVLESMYRQTGEKKRYYGPCGTKFKRRISELSIYQPGVSSTVSALRTFTHDADERKIVSVVDFIEGDFGEIELMPTLFQAQDQAEAAQLRRCYVLDLDMLELRYGRMPIMQELENQGGGRRGYVDSVFGLVVKNPLGLGKFAATS